MRTDRARALDVITLVVTIIGIVVTVIIALHTYLHRYDEDAKAVEEVEYSFEVGKEVMAGTITVCKKGSCLCVGFSFVEELNSILRGENCFTPHFEFLRTSIQESLCILCWLFYQLETYHSQNEQGNNRQ